MLILFDIDQTLINTSKLKNIFADNIASICNTDLLTLSRIEKEYLQIINGSSNIDIHNYIKKISYNLNCPSNKLLELYLKNKKIYQLALFKETKIVLQKLSKDHTLGIYSEGSVFFQTLKLKNSGIYDFFSKDHIYIFKKKLEESNIKLIPKESIIIDDKKEVIQQLSKLNYKAIQLTSTSKLDSILDRLS